MSIEITGEEMRVLRDALVAAKAVVNERGTPGAMARTQNMRDALEAATDSDPILATMVAAAVWLDRYGNAVASERLPSLREALARLETP
jgi:hypothetical protein